MKNDQHDIFEDLQHLLALDYLSDLRFHPYRKEAERLLVSLDLTKYSLRALCEIAEYLFSKKISFSTYADAAEFFARGTVCGDPESETEETNEPK
jgi:hypothetical protein